MSSPRVLLSLLNFILLTKMYALLWEIKRRLVVCFFVVLTAKMPDILGIATKILSTAAFRWRQ